MKIDGTPGGPGVLFGTRTLGASLGSLNNSLNALRLAFAGCVILSHAWWLGGYGPEPALYGIKLGTAGVLGFFAISGYLITVSAERTTPLEYAAARFTRLYPGLFIAAPVTAFVAAPIGALITHGHYDLQGAFTFLGAALGLCFGLMNTPAIGTTLLGNTDRYDWDGPLWTLTWEVLCYIIVAIAVYLFRSISRSGKGHGAAILILFAASTGAVLGKVLGGGFGPDRAEFVLPLVAVFMAAALLATLRERVRVGILSSMAALLIIWAGLATGYGAAVAPLPFAYLVLSVGSTTIGVRIGSRYDISYGVYIYGWPVQQLLAAARVPSHLPVLGYAALALILVWPLGFLSCVAIEQPAQRLRRALHFPGWLHGAKGRARHHA